ncbi:MAG: glycosyl transferase family 1 [Flavobacteriales bacterium]|nr:MAG: glycosyl transferase family 1 [Flavobacteriales bacterium]
MKKVLIISYYWPPAGGPGVQRWLKFVKYLPDFDVEPIVFIPENPHYPILDESLLEEVPKGITILKRPIFEPYALASMLSSKKTKQISAGVIQTKDQTFMEKVLLWVRGNLFIPDARKYWVRPSIKYLSELLEQENIGTIVTTGPPHSVHLIGYGLKRRHPVKWVADFRDPWTSIGYHGKLKLTSFARNKHKALEHKVLNAADKIIVTSRHTKIEFQKITERPISVITNGYDVNFGQQMPKLDDKFTFSHIGSLLSGRNPKNLWQVFSQLIRESDDFKNSIQIDLIGVVSNEVLDDLDRYGLTPYTNKLGYLTHGEAVQRQRRSQVLLLLEIDSVLTQGIIPGKLFEYLASQRPILGIGPSNWEAGEIIKQTKTGMVFDHSTGDALKSVILEWFGKYRQNSLNVTGIGVQDFSRRALTKKLAKEL